MRKYLLFALAICSVNTVFGQKSHVYGAIRSSRAFPMKNVETFVYAQDSSIVASAYTDSMGRYETNNVMPGTYTVKVVYPAVKKAITISAVPVKGNTLLNLRMDPPAEDTMLNYTDVAPKPEPKSSRRKKM